MGFRSTFVTDDCSWVWPQWFRDKYPGVHFPEEFGPISSIREAKTYMSWDGRFIADIQKCLIERDDDPCLTLVFLHECGGVTRYEISPNSIAVSEPRFWGTTECVTHMYCYGCSDARSDLDMPEDYAATIQAHKDRADKMEASRDSIRSQFQMQVNAKVAEFVNEWKSTAKSAENIDR